MPSKKIYVAGPYTNPDPVENTRNAILAADELRRLGFTPFVPHLTLMWHLVAPQWLALCDGLLRLPGRSVGADNEVALARRLGIPVYTSIVDLIRDHLCEPADFGPAEELEQRA